MAWLSGYSKRKKITLTGGSSGAQTDFPLQIAASYEAAMQGDFDDLRFTQADGTTLIDAWAEVIVTDTSATVWVEFPTTPANTVEQDYYMYYGNSGAAADWNGEGTFDLFDDFAGIAALDRISYGTLWSGTGATDWLGRTAMVQNGNEWIVVYRQGDAHIGDGNSVYHIRFSDDEGATWSDPDKLVNGNSVTGFPISGSDSKDAEGASIILAPNGDLLVQSCERTISGELDATYQYRSTNDGATWSSEGKINNDPDFLGGHTSDHVVVGSTIYLAITSCKYSNFDSACLYKSTNNGTTWTFVSDITTSNTNEPGMEYLGNNTLLVVLRTSDKTKTYQRKSTDMGATWGTLTDVTSQLGIFQRPWLHIYSGEPDRVYAVGRDDLASEYTVVYWTDDGGDNWSAKFYPDPTGYTDAAYCDMLQKDNGDFYLLSYGGTTTTASITKYIFDRSGAGIIDHAKWDIYDAPAIVSGKVELDNDDGIVSKTKFGYGYAFEGYSIADEQDIGLVCARELITDENNVLYLLNSDTNPDDFDKFKLYSAEAGTSTENYVDNWDDFRSQYRRYSILRPVADDVTYIQDAHSYNQTTGNITTVDLGLAFYVWDSSQESKLTVDWAFVRKYVVNPATYAFGSEESAPAEGAWYYEMLRRRNR